MQLLSTTGMRPGANESAAVVGLIIRIDDGPECHIPGRFASTLHHLILAGDKGLTSLENPAPRTSHYVFWLRTKAGVSIETEREPHTGPYAGNHARYRLASKVEVLRIIRAGDKPQHKAEVRHAAA
jgi:hypothetical protein